MNINDILEKEFGVDFKKVDKFLTKEMHNTAGEYLVNYMENVFGNEDNAKRWYFTEIPALGNRRPYDYCKEEKYQEIEEELVSIEHGFPA